MNATDEVRCRARCDAARYAGYAQGRADERAALKADLEAARATIASLAEKIAQAVEDDTKRMREQIEERRMFREIGGYLRMRFNRLLSRLHDRKDVSLTECFDLLDADLARHKRALAAGPAALRVFGFDGYAEAARDVEAAQEAAMKDDGKKGGG